MAPDPAFQEFVDVLNELAGVHTFALQGIREARKYWVALLCKHCGNVASMRRSSSRRADIPAAAVL